ncbi:MAG: hypothetical protein HY700_01975 [Gemmatimonadetes bacterium]|nr:hypothetical protein [Gemmatimonadota bacterium]
MIAITSSPAAAQQSADSVAQQVHALARRVDSLQRELDRLAGSRQDTTQLVVDELAELRAAAGAAAGRQDTSAQRADTGRAGASRTRMQTQLNPEISVTGDVRLAGNRPGPQADNVDFREFEFGFQSPLDPYAFTKIFLSFEGGHFDIEEAYAYWTGLPGHVRLDLGRFRQQLGELNRWHLHGIPETEYPLVHHEYLGDDGLVGDGVGLYWVMPTEGAAIGTHELWGQVTRGNNEVLFRDGNRLSFLGHLNNFWQLSPSLFFQLGVSGVYGANPDQQLKTRLLAADVRLSWRPPARALYRSFTLRAEGFADRPQVAGVGPTYRGGYVSGEYQLSRRIFAGLRYDRVQTLADGGIEWMAVPHLTWWQSEWVFLKAEWQHDSKPAGITRDASDRFVVQAVWSIGPHKHETY